MIRSVVKRLASLPAVFDLLRWILEGGFSGHQSVFENELRDTGGWVVDLGCGTGQHCRKFVEELYIGVDLSFDYLKAAWKSNRGHHWCQADAMRLPLRDHSIQKVVVSGLLHHLDDPSVLEVLSEAARILDHGGLLVVWEDIPTVVRWNLVGRVVHRFDLGHHIRRAEGYGALLSRSFKVISERKIRSGFMDYAVFVCEPRLTA